MDVAGVYERVGLAVAPLAKVHGGVERIGEAIGKHPGQLGMGQHLLHAGNLLLHCRGAEEALLLGRTVGGIADGRADIVLHGDVTGIVADRCLYGTGTCGEGQSEAKNTGVGAQRALAARMRGLFQFHG